MVVRRLLCWRSRALRGLAIVTAASGLVGAPAGLGAQLMPGGQPVDVVGLRAEFYQMMVGIVRELMDAWHERWLRADGVSLGRLYTEDATLVQPGGLPLQGQQGVAELVGALSSPLTSGVRTGMRDLEASDGIAYFSGSYSIDPRTADRAPNTGRHFTVIEREGRQWLIRFQWFLPDSGSAAVPAVPTPELMEPLTLARIGEGRRGPSRLFAYSDAQYLLRVFLDSWKRRDVPDAKSGPVPSPSRTGCGRPWTGSGRSTPWSWTSTDGTA
jgi:ketosteroid isomerase-like protein